MADKLSEDEFRKALYDSLSKKGVVSSFKSHLRNQLALHLSKESKVTRSNHLFFMVKALLITLSCVFIPFVGER